MVDTQNEDHTPVHHARAGDELPRNASSEPSLRILRGVLLVPPVVVIVADVVPHRLRAVAVLVVETHTHIAGSAARASEVALAGGVTAGADQVVQVAIAHLLLVVATQYKGHTPAHNAGAYDDRLSDASSEHSLQNVVIALLIPPIVVVLADIAHHRLLAIELLVARARIHITGGVARAPEVIHRGRVVAGADLVAQAAVAPLLLVVDPQAEDHTPVYDAGICGKHPHTADSDYSLRILADVMLVPLVVVVLADVVPVHMPEQKVQALLFAVDPNPAVLKGVPLLVEEANTHIKSGATRALEVALEEEVVAGADLVAPAAVVLLDRVGGPQEEGHTPVHQSDAGSGSPLRIVVAVLHHAVDVVQAAHSAVVVTSDQPGLLGEASTHAPNEFRDVVTDLDLRGALIANLALVLPLLALVVGEIRTPKAETDEARQRRGEALHDVEPVGGLAGVERLLARDDALNEND